MISYYFHQPMDTHTFDIFDSDRCMEELGHLLGPGCRQVSCRTAKGGRRIRCFDAGLEIHQRSSKGAKHHRISSSNPIFSRYCQWFSCILQVRHTWFPWTPGDAGLVLEAWPSQKARRCDSTPRAGGGIWRHGVAGVVEKWRCHAQRLGFQQEKGIDSTDNGEFTIRNNDLTTWHDPSDWISWCRNFQRYQYHPHQRCLLLRLRWLGGCCSRGGCAFGAVFQGTNSNQPVLISSGLKIRSHAVS